MAKNIKSLCTIFIATALIATHISTDARVARNGRVGVDRVGVNRVNVARPVAAPGRYYYNGRYYNYRYNGLYYLYFVGGVYCNTLSDGVCVDGQ